MSPSRIERVVLWSTRVIAGLAALIVVGIFVFLFVEALPALRATGLTRFFSDAAWYPADGPQAGQFNLLPMLAATLALSAGAIGLAGFSGVLLAAFYVLYAPPAIAKWYRRMLEILAGIPSVVYGFWGLVTITPLIREFLGPPGQSLLAAILILALMILPTVALLAGQALQAVPRSYLAGAAALGLSRTATLLGVVIPAARGGIASAVLLAAGRALGETMAVLMVAGNVVQMPESLTAPVRTLTANIALELGYAMSHHRSALFVSGLVLLVLIFALTMLVEWIQFHGSKNTNANAYVSEQETG